jgi:signal-transduction protein with cAMP-binding, CBS, and nucleotidyltransferase domain
MSISYYVEDDLVMEEHDIVEEIFFILHGKVRLSKHGEELCHLGEGDFIGEISFLYEERKNTIQAICASVCKIGKVSNNSIWLLSEAYPSFKE